MAKKKILPDIIIIEIILVRADWRRTFIGSIFRESDNEGNPVLRGEVFINEGMAWSKSSDEEELRNNLDDICLLKLDYNLHSNPGITIKIFGENFFLN
jgi:hypothetical protein